MRWIERQSSFSTDEKACEFIGVSIPERMGLEETVRLTRALERLKVQMRRLLINNIVPMDAAADCDFCSARRASQESVIKDFRRRLGKVCSLFIAPEQPHEIRGVEALREHFNQWKALDKKLKSSKK